MPEENISTFVLDKFKEHPQVRELIENIIPHSNKTTDQESDLEALTVILDEYLEQPHLIDPHLDEFINKLLELVKQPNIPLMAFHQTFKYLNLFIKVRGFKQATHHFTHEVADLEFVLDLLNKQSRTDYEYWESRYVLLLWLAMVVMIPFDLKRLDGLDTAKKSILDRILDSVQPYLKGVDKCQDAASYLVARLLTRPDVKDIKLSPFIIESLDRLKSLEVNSMSAMNEVSGILAVLALIFKHGRRDDLLPFGPLVLSCIEKLQLLDIENTSIRKLTIKLTQRLGLIFLVPRIAAWRYHRGNRSIAENLASSTIVTDEEKPNKDQVERPIEEEDFDIPEEVETVLEFLLTGLKDKDTIVRWSAAKGVGRITGRLPQELADEVVGSLLELFVYSELDGAWHGGKDCIDGCLAFAELGRRGLLLPKRLKEVVPIVLKALTYDERRGAHSVGAHVRDAACYVCWSFARAYDPQQIKPYVLDIATSLLITTIFDREVNCRRAASAAFQENVGRQGTFPHGIDIVTTCDYFAVGNRIHCYTELSVFVGKFKEYTHALIDHLVHDKISHWDSVIRELASKSLACLTTLDPDYMKNHALPSLVGSMSSIDICTKHGAIFATAEVIHALYLNDIQSFVIDAVIMKKIKDLVSTLRSSNRFKGYGGESMRKAVCKLIEKISQSNILVNDNDILDDWLFVLEDTIPHTEPPVQEFAINALPYFCNQYISTSKHFNKDVIVERFLGKLESSNKFDKMGFAQAFSVFPQFMLSNKIKEVIERLIVVTVIESDLTKAGQNAEARKFAVLSLSSVVNTMTLSNHVICDKMNEVFECLFRCIKDYTMYSRGDVGVWVREASMTSMVKITFNIIDQKKIELFNEERCVNILCCLLQQAAEKIDRTRNHAGNLIIDFLYHSPAIPYIPKRNEIEKIIPRCDTMDWASPKSVFELLKDVLPLKEYQYSLLLGFIVSVGGLTESLVRSSSDNLIAFFMEYQESVEEMESVCSNILKIFNHYTTDARVIIPLFKMLDLLLSSGCFELYNTDDKCSSFPAELVTYMRKEIKGVGDANKLLASINVFCGLLQFPLEVRKPCLMQLSLFLCHKYPRIRVSTAEQLYTALITFEEGIIPDVHYQDILSKLTEVPWADSLPKLRPIRNQICDWLDIPKPKLKNGALNEQPVVNVDELDSYKDLVSRQHGY